MALSAYETKILTAIPEGKNTPIVAKYAVAVAKQLRSSFKTKYSYELVVDQIMDTMDVVQTKGTSVLVRSISDTKRIVSINIPDQPFIVDTTRMHLHEMGAVNVTGFNVIVGLKRNELGSLVEVGEEFQLESVIRFEVEGAFFCSVSEMQDKLMNVLQISKVVVDDFKAMTKTMQQARDSFLSEAQAVSEQRENLLEAADFVHWLLQENFVFMGLHTADKAMGVLRESCKDKWEQDILQWNPTVGKVPVVVKKGNQNSPVHRVGLVDEIFITIPDRMNKQAEVLRIVGLFTYRAINQTSRHVPVLRQVLADIIRQDGPTKGSFRYKSICNVFDSLPTEFLFNATIPKLLDLIEHVLEAEQESDVRIDLVEQDRQDTAFVLMALPRMYWSEDRLPGVVNILKQHTKANYVDHGAFVGRYNTMLIHFFLTGASDLHKQRKDVIVQEIQNYVRSWRVKMNNALTEQYGEDVADNLMAKYGMAFSDLYQKMRPTNESVKDIGMLERLATENGPLVDIFVVESRNRAYLRVYQTKNLLLSDMLPVIDNFGLKVLDQFADPVVLADGTKYIIDTFRLEPSQGVSVDSIIEHSREIADGIEAVFAGKMETDSLNYLVLHAGLTWQSVDAFRAIFGYAKQLGLNYTVDRLQNILLANTDVVKALWNVFAHKFDPKLDNNRSENLQKAQETCDGLIRAVTDQTQDFVYRTVFNLMDSMLRTNFYRTDRLFHYISFKVDCNKVKNMAPPRMMVEVYVHHKQMEGIHLRGGKIARGGIRWSDRTDFRREILDLVSTQMVKNVLIVPEGAKGGFRMKEQILDWGERRRKADELYKVLVRGLLDVTDNQVAGAIVHPPNVVRYDTNDPYLVVAADKGTAHLSDTANKLSAEYGFWLGDAFASGGSNGYDHKEVGITARGGWTTVLRHFAELGIDPTQEDFTTVGIGDPAGDVFGNGVVYLDQKSKGTNHMKLLGAFNHKHIFLDPNPNTQAAYEERVRLFNNVQDWGSYNTALISKGGGIFNRSAKSIPISAEVQQMLGLLPQTTELAPEVIIRMLLRLNVDLLWNGGIGTYVKASFETDLDAGDPSNDTLRVNACDLRARIIGEGGNLGFTQHGRVEYALNGGRINTDAIDNSGGVDMSDHEVNLKILLNPMVHAGELALDDRNTLVESMTEEVAQDVLHNNDIHGRQLSLDVVRSQKDPLAFSIAIQWVCTRSATTRAFLRLPTDEELIRRQGEGKGLSRPELAVLAAHIKMHIFKDLLKADVSVIPNFAEIVMSYFPAKIQEKYAQQVQNHMLRPSIGLTVLLNEMVGDAGALLFPTLTDITNAKAEDIVCAWLFAMDAIQADALKAKIDTIPTLSGQYNAWTSITKPLLSLLTTWLFDGQLPSSSQKASLQSVLKRLPSLLDMKSQERQQRAIEELRAKDVPEELAKEIVALENISFAYEIAKDLDASADVDKAIVAYLAIGEASMFLKTVRLLENRRASGGWDPAANAILRNRFLHLLKQTTQVIDLGEESNLSLDRMSFRLQENHLAELHDQMQGVITESIDLAALVVGNARALAIVNKMRQAGAKLQGTGFSR